MVQFSYVSTKKMASLYFCGLWKLDATTKRRFHVILRTDENANSLGDKLMFSTVDADRGICRKRLKTVIVKIWIYITSQTIFIIHYATWTSLCPHNLTTDHRSHYYQWNEHFTWCTWTTSLSFQKPCTKSLAMFLWYCSCWTVQAQRWTCRWANSQGKI